MKGKIFSALLLLSLMAILPITVSKCTVKTVSAGKTATSDTVQYSSDNETDLCALTAALYRDSYCSETIKAIAIIMNTDYIANPDNFEKDDFLYKKDATGSTVDVYDQIENCVKKVKQTTLRKENKVLFVPYSITSNGSTYSDGAYPYICSVASPWDCWSDSYDNNAQCIGVSLSGIDWLCKNGYSAENALKWYLPNFDICKE